MVVLCAFGILALSYIIYKIVSFVWFILYPHILAKWFGLRVDLRSLGEWAVVTGATDGIGKAYAKELAKRGLNIFLISRNEDRLKSSEDEIRAVAPTIKTKVLAMDFSKADSDTYRTIIANALSGLEIGVLVNNVGMCYPYPEQLLNVRNGDEKFLDDMLRVNCETTMQMSRVILGSMVERRKGAIINLASFFAFAPAPYLTIYSACKAFVDYFTRGLRGEYCSSGIIFQVVYPFYVATKMSGRRKRPFWVADPDEYAASALDTVGIVDQTCGSIAHEIQGLLLNLLPTRLITMSMKRSLQDMREKYLRIKQQRAQMKLANGQNGHAAHRQNGN